jgi:thiol-disulfide isomerase/thioredoxin
MILVVIAGLSLAAHAGEPAKGAAPASAPSTTPAAPAPAAPAAKALVTIAAVNDKDFVEKVLAPRKGKAVLVSFWASYCQPCLEELPALLDAKKRVQKKGGDIVVVNVDPPGENGPIQKIAERRKFPAFETLQVENEDPQPFIDAIDKKWGGEVPFAVVYGKDGALKKTFSGEQKIADLEAALDEVLKQP